MPGSVLLVVSCSGVLVVIVIIFDCMLFTEFSGYLISYCLTGWKDAGKRSKHWKLRPCLVELHLILIIYGSRFSKRSDYVPESDSFLFFSMNSWNHDGESLHRIRRNYFFPALSLLVHFRESLHGISRESLLSEKLFDRAPAGFSRESALGAPPNGTIEA